MAVRRGDAAKEAATNIICNAFDNVVGIQDKKIYVNVKDGPGGETVQLAISMTMPKTPIAAVQTTSNDWTSNDAPKTSTAAASVELSDSDKATIQKLKERLDIKD